MHAVRAADPDVYELAKSGKLSVADAKRLIETDKKLRTAAVEKIEAGEKPKSVIEASSLPSSASDDVYDTTGKLMKRAATWDRERRLILINELKNVIDSLEAMQ